ncbi:hypothetical protein BKA70DRAFT_1229269 [Coprinopsis sp. MPI-PUGE-AT-0042]|nr:hypothetical protein BKA70DRAFT_1229269 [Coprinopsis sp. MPI-PUGE-AT-0042]
MASLQDRSLEYRVLHTLVVEFFDHRCPKGHRVTQTVLMGHLDVTTYGQRQVRCRGGCCHLSSPRLTVLQRVVLKNKVTQAVNLIKVMQAMSNPARFCLPLGSKRKAIDEVPHGEILHAKKPRIGTQPRPHPSVPEIIDLTGSDSDDEALDIACSQLLNARPVADTWLVGMLCEWNASECELKTSKLKDNSSLVVG